MTRTGSSRTWWTRSEPSLMPRRCRSAGSGRDVSRSPFGSRMSSASSSSQDVADARPVVGVALEVVAVPLDHPGVRRRVDVVDRAADRRQPAGDERLPQALRRDRQVGHGAEAAEALAEDAPALDPELLPDELRIADDRVGAEVGQVLGLCLRRVTRNVADRRRSAGAALVEQQQPVVLQRPLDPAVGGSSAASPRSPDRPGGTQVRLVLAAERGDLAREDRDRRPVGGGVVSGTSCSRSVRITPGARFVTAIGDLLADPAVAQGGDGLLDAARAGLPGSSSGAWSVSRSCSSTTGDRAVAFPGVGPPPAGSLASPSGARCRARAGPRRCPRLAPPPRCSLTHDHVGAAHHRARVAVCAGGQPLIGVTVSGRAACRPERLLAASAGTSKLITSFPDCRNR